MRSLHIVPALVCLTAFAALAGPAPAQLGITTRASVDSAGNQGNNDSSTGSFSADGRFVAFQSYANNLGVGDTNGYPDIFVHDRSTGETTLVSVDSSGAVGNYYSYYWNSSLSTDGRYVAFFSYSSNLVPGDTNNAGDAFVHDRSTGVTTRVSVDTAGNQGNSNSTYTSLSADGRFVAFNSNASNLVPGDTNNVADAFVYDRQAGKTTRVSVNSAGKQVTGSNYYGLFPYISADGQFVAFHSIGSDLVPGDTNNANDVFVHDRITGETTRVSLDSGGLQGNNGSYYPSISQNGRFVAFESSASNLVPGDTNGYPDVFVHDRATGQTMRASVGSTGNQATGESIHGSISYDGRYVAFHSFAGNLVPGDTNFASDVFKHDRLTGTTERASIDSDQNQGNSGSYYPYVSADGRLVAFYSYATNLVPGDTNQRVDIFVQDPLGCPQPKVYCTPKATTNFCIPSIGWTGEPSLAAPSAYAVETVDMEEGKYALTFFATSGPAGAAFQGGFLCVQPPLHRLPIQATGGAGPCQGSIGYTLQDMLAHPTGSLELTPGTIVHCQTWGRDPGDLYTTSLSDGLEFTVCPR